MGVQFEVVDVAYPYVCAVYRCPCGAVAASHGDGAATPPPNWLDRPAAGDADELVLCPHCAQVARERGA